MQTTIAVFLIIFVVVCLIAYLSLWNAIDDIKNSLGYIKSSCNNSYDIRNTEHILHELISKSHKDLLTEIACLATKNNEDIKRANGDFKAWDMFEYKKEVYVIYHIEHGNDGTITYKCKSGLGFIADFNKAEMACAKFLRTASPFKIKE